MSGNFYDDDSSSLREGLHSSKPPMVQSSSHIVSIGSQGGSKTTATSFNTNSDPAPRARSGVALKSCPSLPTRRRNVNFSYPLVKKLHASALGSEKSFTTTSSRLARKVRFSNPLVTDISTASINDPNDVLATWAPRNVDHRPTTSLSSARMLCQAESTVHCLLYTSSEAKQATTPQCPATPILSPLQRFDFDTILPEVGLPSPAQRTAPSTLSPLKRVFACHHLPSLATDGVSQCSSTPAIRPMHTGADEYIPEISLDQG